MMEMNTCFHIRASLKIVFLLQDHVRLGEGEIKNTTL
jgi:hypothetical protein